MNKSEIEEKFAIFLGTVETNYKYGKKLYAELKALHDHNVEKNNGEKTKKINENIIKLLDISIECFTQ